MTKTRRAGFRKKRRRGSRKTVKRRGRKRSTRVKRRGRRRSRRRSRGGKRRSSMRGGNTTHVSKKEPWYAHPLDGGSCSLGQTYVGGQCVGTAENSQLMCAPGYRPDESGKGCNTFPDSLIANPKNSNPTYIRQQVTSEVKRDNPQKQGESTKDYESRIKSQIETRFKQWKHPNVLDGKWVNQLSWFKNKFLNKK